MSYFVIAPTGGLCNYLRVLFSFKRACERDNKHLICIWRITSACPGYFLDYFEPVPGVTFLHNNIKNYKINYEGFDWHPDFHDRDGFNYADLKLIPSVQEKVNLIVSNLNNNFSAMHIRRTDHIGLAKSVNLFMPDELFINYCKTNSDKYIYIATDNQITQQKFITLFPNQIKYYNLISNNRKLLSALRQTTLEHTIIDIFVCAHSTNFMGTAYSSLSELIHILRNHIRK